MQQEALPDIRTAIKIVNRWKGKLGGKKQKKGPDSMDQERAKKFLWQTRNDCNSADNPREIVNGLEKSRSGAKRTTEGTSQYGERGRIRLTGLW